MKRRQKKASRHKLRISSRYLWLGGILLSLLYVWAVYHIFVSPTGFRWRAFYGDAKYPEGYEIHGIDISHYQGTIDWKKLKNGMIEGCPVRFVVVKATEGSTKVDSRYKENF